MSIIDGGTLPTTRKPKTLGDQLPGKYPEYKDGVEEKWTRKEAKAIRGLAAGYHPNVVAKKCRIKIKTLEGWMGNPYFMMEVQSLVDHNVFRFRAAVLETVARRAIAGSSQHARLFLQVTKDLKSEEGPQKNLHIHQEGQPGEDVPTPEEMDTALMSELEKFLGQ